jgi:hypothetical protein
VAIQLEWTAVPGATRYQLQRATDGPYSVVEDTTPGLGLLLTFGTRGAGNGQFSSPAGIAVDAAGGIYVSDNPDGGRVQKYRQ